MLTQVTCPTCGAARDDFDVSCPACGFASSSLDAAEELIAGWMVASTAPEPPPTDRDMVCVACGYEGPMIASPEGERVLCPACGDPWQDRGGLIKKSACPDCGQVLLLSEQLRGKTIICPKCHSLLGCLIPARGRREWRGHSTILDLMALAAACALGYMWAVALWAQHAPRPVLNGISVVVLPITCTLVALRFLGRRPSRRRRFVPPGLAACLAVSAASAFNACCAWNAATIPTIPQDPFVVTALRVVEPQPIAAAVVAVWALLILDRRWRLERSWIDRLGRCLGIYWLAAGLVASLF